MGKGKSHYEPHNPSVQHLVSVDVWASLSQKEAEGTAKQLALENNKTIKLKP